MTNYIYSIRAIVNGYHEYIGAFSDRELVTEVTIELKNLYPNHDFTILRHIDNVLPITVDMTIKRLESLQ